MKGLISLMSDDKVLAASMAMVLANFASYNTDYWYDNFHTYITFDTQTTPLIDSMLIKRGHIRSFMIVGNTMLPGPGTHYYQFSNKFPFFTSIGFNKRLHPLVQEEKYYYIAWIPPFQYAKNALTDFITLMQRSDMGCRVISIDTSLHVPAITHLSKMCGSARPHQKVAIDYIMRQYSVTNNVKCILHGKRGVGKSYTAMLLKKEMERKMVNRTVLLFDDFNPNSIGVNVKTMALARASETTPVIIVINELDRVLNQVTSESTSYDPREQHTRDVQSWNNMMDAISLTPYTILICTTEYDNLQIKYQSLLRSGRIDHILNIIEND
jgi:hypothetical protein